MFYFNENQNIEFNLLNLITNETELLDYLHDKIFIEAAYQPGASKINLKKNNKRINVNT